MEKWRKRWQVSKTRKTQPQDDCLEGRGYTQAT